MPLIKQNRPVYSNSYSWGKGSTSADSMNNKNNQNLSPPSSPGLFGGRRRLVRKRRGEDDERWKKNKKLIDHHVRRLATLVGKDLSVNPEGLVFFPFKKFIVVLEVPADNPNKCFIYTMVCRLGRMDNESEVLKAAMRMNYMHSGTRGATLGLEGEEVNLCYSCNIPGLSADDLHSAVHHFLLTAVEVNEKLDCVKKYGCMSCINSFDSI